MEESQCDVAQLCQSMCNLVKEYMGYSVKLAVVHRPCICWYEAWKPPFADFIKINFYAYVGFKYTRGLGVVIRNDQGRILMTGTKRVQAN